MAKRATKKAPEKREPTPRELYRAECAQVAEMDPRWQQRQVPEECSRCDSAFSSWVAPSGEVMCPGCWDWLSDGDADTLPALAPPKPEPRLPAGVKHPACPRCPAGGKRPSYEWGWTSRSKNRKRILEAHCAKCLKPCGEVDQKVFAAFAPPLPPGPPPTGDIFDFCQDPDDEIGFDALDVQGVREKQASKVSSAKDRIRLRVPTVTARCRTCGMEERGILWPEGAEGETGFVARPQGVECLPCMALERLEAQAPHGHIWAHARATTPGAPTESVRAPVEEVGWSYEGDFAYEPRGYYGLRWEDFRIARAKRDARVVAGRREGAGTYRDAVDPTGSPMTEKDVREYLHTATTEKFDRWIINKFACGITSEIKRRKL